VLAVDPVRRGAARCPVRGPGHWSWSRRQDEGPVEGPPRRVRGTMASVSSSGSTRAVFRVSPLVLLFALAVAVCATPVAFGAPFLWLVYLVPVGIVVWTLRTRTVVDAEGLRVRRVVGGRRIAWDDATGLRLDGRGRVRVVLAAGGEPALPAVGVRDLHALAVASGGRLPDPTGG
jgi:hypothetical protein